MRHLITPTEDQLHRAGKFAFEAQLSNNPAADTISSEHIFAALEEYGLSHADEGAVEQKAESLWRRHLASR